jgi:hypothetical protein
MRCLHTLLALCFCICHCKSFGIRSPPPVYRHTEIAASKGCSGVFDGWKWDRCVLDGAVAWTAVAFGHIQISTALGFHPPNFLGSHVQYAPSSLEQPFIVNRDGLDARSVKQQLPPLVFALYIQSEELESSFWHPFLTCELDSASSEEDGIGWHSIELRSQFRSNLTVLPEYRGSELPVRTDILRIISNTEYVFDNVILHSFGPMFPSQPLPDQVHMLNIDAHMQLHDMSSSQDKSVFAERAIWTIQFVVAFDGPKTLPSISPPPASPKRAFANLVSHNMCETAARYAAPFLQFFL